MAKKDKDKQLEIDLGDVPPTENFMAETDNPAPEVVVLAEEDQKAPIGADEGIEKLKSKLKDAKQRYREEKKARQEAEIAAQRASSEVEENQTHLVSNAIDTLKRDQEILKAHLRDVMATGDYDRAVELQEMFQQNINKLARLEDGLNEMRNQPKKAEFKTPSPDDVVDNLIRQVTPRSAKWLNKNRDHLQDARALRIMERAHLDAVDSAIIPESDEYFKFIENRLGIKKKDKSEKDRKEKKEKKQEQYQEPYQENIMSSASDATQRRYAPPAAAPVSRSGAGPSGNPRVVRLTPDQAEAARISGISPQQYWENLQREKNRSTTH